MDVAFTQYLRPHGERRPVLIDRSPDIATVAAGLVTAGCRFDIEVLTTGHVSMTIEQDDAEGETHVLAQRVVPNGPEVPTAVDELVMEANGLLSARTGES